MRQITFREINIGENTGRLFLHSMPGRYEQFEEFIIATETERVTTIVSLTPRREIAEKSNHYLRAIESGDARLPELIEAPVNDYSVPPDGQIRTYMTAIQLVVSRLHQGQNVLVHCGAGIGRTGTFAVMILWVLGHSLSESLEQVRRAGSGPENERQNLFLARHTGRIDFGEIGISIGDELLGPESTKAFVASSGGSLVQIDVPQYSGVCSLRYATNRVLGQDLISNAEVLGAWRHHGVSLAELARR